MSPRDTAYLAGDVGGTKTNLALFTEAEGLRTPVVDATIPSADYDSLESLVESFLSDAGLGPKRAAFGVAGPVVEGEAKITNLPWHLSEARIADRLGMDSVELVNDLVAIAKSVSILDFRDLHTLAEGEPVEHGPIAVVAPGTGLGEAYLVWQGDHYHAYPSEGGHADFAPLDKEQVALLEYMQKRVGHVSYELVCSGTGIAYLYEFLRDTGRAPAKATLDHEVTEAKEPTRAILERALDDPDPPEICMRTAELFARILAAETGNMALNVLSLGGVYLGGGLPPRMLSVLSRPAFMERVRAKGRFEKLLSQFPVHVMLNPKAALYGAAQLCREERRRYEHAG